MADDIVLGAKQIPNPENIKPKLDTEPPDTVVPTGAKMDISNPADTNIEGKQHPIEQHFSRSKPRHPLGRGIPKAQVTDN
jgi:hypothetical protein